MRKYLIRLTVFALTTLLGAVSSLIGRGTNTGHPRKIAEVVVKAESAPGRSFIISDSDPDLPRSLSPYDVALFVSGRPHVNLTKLWQALNVDATQFNGMPTNADFFPTICENCEAETFEYDLDGIPGTEGLLRIGGRVDYSYRYLIFKYDANKWRIPGYIDAWGKYRKPQHTIIINHGVTWLDIQQQGANGSGVASYVDGVYLVTPKRVIEAFTYTSDGHEFGLGASANREFTGRVSDCSLNGTTVTAAIQYSVTYVGDDDILFTKAQHAVFSRILGSQPQRLDRTRSDLSLEELEAVYNIDSLSNEAFLKYNHAELGSIASGADVERKQWLSNFLEICNDTIESRRLKHLLARRT